MGPAPLPEIGFLDDWAARLRQAADRPAVGIMLRGSHARRAATEHSDVDVDVLVAADDERTGPAAPDCGAAGPARPGTDDTETRAAGPAYNGTPYAARRAYLAEFDGRLVHVSVAARDVRSWVNRLGQPADWAFGLPVTAPARLLWAAPEWRRRIDLPVLCQPADEPRLEELIATLGKVAGARWAGDPVGVRLAAADLARLCPSVLRLANPSVRVVSRRAALAAALDLPVAPPGYRDDMLLCLGLRPGGTAEVGAAAGRLVTGTVPLVRPYAGEIAAVGGSDLAAALVDGRLDRYLGQLTRALDRPAPASRDTSAVPVPRAGEWST
ncbi:phosphoribosyl-AMP cyclohydrolase, partial [Micromonospora sp. AMSO31t]|uniref:phosphoribosyl-AMP cyclohydrolase n=1 Tax=Micromonospora sp. AMSO31t TaxID=2650566 RepID=UPI00124B3864